MDQINSKGFEAQMSNDSVSVNLKKCFYPPGFAI